MEFIHHTDELYHLLSKLDPNQIPSFGKMTPQHMVEHLALIVRLSNGRIQVPVKFPAEKVAFYKKNIIEGPDPIPQGVQMEKGNDQLPELRNPGLAEAEAVS